MPVRESERELSPTEFLKVLKDIEKFFIKLENTKPKKFRYFITQHLINNAAQALTFAKIANSIYVSKNEEESKRERRLYLQKSYAYVQALNTQTDVLYSMNTGQLFSNAEIKEISELIYQALKLLKGVMDSDKKRYKQ